MCGGDHRQVQALLFGTINGNLVTRIRVAHHAGCRVVMQHASNTCRRFVGTVTDDDHPGVLGEAHPDAAAVVQRHQVAPLAVFSRAFSSGQSETASEPSRMASVSRFGLATEPESVVAANDDRRGDFAAAHHFVKGEAEFLPPLQPDPADTRR